MSPPDFPLGKQSVRSSWAYWLPILVLVSAGGGAFLMHLSAKSSRSSERGTPAAVVEASSLAARPSPDARRSPDSRPSLDARRSADARPEPAATLVANPAADPPETTTVHLPKDQWRASKLQLQPVAQGTLATTVELTGKISLNQDRIAHIYPMVEGSVESVSVSLGGSVEAGELLAVINSREIGEAKLTLFQARLQLEMAQTKNQLQAEVARNTRELITRLREKTPIEEIESMFHDRPMGAYREQALAAYSKVLKSSADVARLEGIAGTGAVSGKQLLAAEANRRADQATYQARLEQIQYELSTSTLLSSQALKEAETQVAVAETSLRILGCEEGELDEIHPAQQGEEISHYFIRAPFNGTVLTKDVVLSEQVRPDVMLLSIADLSTVWVTADIYQEHLPLLASLQERNVVLRSKAWPDKTFQAQIFYTGEIMDESTRTISMRAIANNDDRLLKPGMFVTVELPGGTESEVLQVPRSALQAHEGQTFVFVHQQGDQFQRRDVKVGRSNETSVAVQEGLKPGESVVTQGGFILKSRMLADLLGE